MSKKRRKNSNYQTEAYRSSIMAGSRQLGKPSKPSVKTAPRKMNFTLFEIVVLGLVISWVAAFLLSQRLGASIHVWVTLVTYVGVGLLLLIRPVTFVEFLAKRNEALLRDQTRISKLNRRIRVVALVLLVMGVIFGRSLVLNIMSGLDIYGVGADTGVYGEAADTAAE
jgi:hypothetical protein